MADELVRPDGSLSDPGSGGDGAVATFQAVVRALERWQPGEVDNQNVPDRLRQSLDRELNGETDGVLDRDVVERRRGSNPADITVNGEIGIRLVGQVRQATINEVNVTLSLLAGWYNFVVIYWLDPSPRNTDYRRTIERNSSSHQLGVRRLSFVTGGEVDGPEPGDVSGRSSHALAVSTAGLFSLVLSGVGLLAWTLTSLTGPGRLLLVGVAGLFVGILALGILVGVR